MIRLFFLLALIFPTLSSAWTVTADFEQGTVGARADGPSGLGYAATATFYSNTRAASGSKSAIVNFVQGTEVGTGGSVGWPNVTEGGEVWARGYYYYASPFNWTCSPVVKILRTRVNNAANDHIAWHSIFADSLGRIMISNEVQSYQQASSTYFDINQWQSLELYVKFSATQGVIRIWKNGILVIEDTTRRTLAASSNISNQGNIYTYWNGGHPQNQTGWIDDFIWTNERPANRDAAGNYMIGPANWSGGGSTTYTVTPSAGANGSISPNTAQTVTSGATAQFTVTPNSGYTASVGGTCGGSLAGTVYTTNPISANCTVSATFAGDTTPPTISNPLPSGELPYATTSTTLQVGTSEAATCRYHTSDVAYSSMGSTFGSTGGTTHQQTGFSVSPGQSYTRYVRCIDSSGNATPSSATISFSVSGTNDTIVDNDASSGVSQSGDWWTSTNFPGYYGSNYHSSPAGSGYWFQWSTALSAGTYGVYARWVADPNRSSDVSYQITHAGGTATINNIDQRSNGGQWNLLGTYSFGTTGTVRVLSGTNGTYGTVADAIRFLPSASCKKLSTPTGLSVLSFERNQPSNITMTYGWNAVTTHTDSSALTADLANYRLHWGTTSGGPYNTSSTASDIVQVAVGPTQDNVTYYARIGAESTSDASCNSDLSAEMIYQADATPPIITSSGPTGTLAKNSTTATLTASTSENATCRYGDKGVPFASKTQFSTTGLTSHSSTISVWAGLVKRLCAICSDSKGNESSEVCTVFSVSPKPKRGYFN